MALTPFALFLIVAYGYILVNNKSLIKIFTDSIVVLTVVTLNIRMGYFFEYNGSSMSYIAVTTYITAIISFILIVKRKKVSKRMFNIVCLFIIALVLNFFISKFFPYSGQVNILNWVDYAQGKREYGFLDGSKLQIGLYLVFACNSLILLAIKEYLNIKDVKFIITKTIDYSLIFVISGFVEWILTNILNNNIITQICIVFFGIQGAQHTTLIHRGSLFTIQGATKEPSMFATAIFYLSVLLILRYCLDKDISNHKYKKWMIMCFILLAINPSLSSYTYLLIDLILFYIINRGTSQFSKYTNILRKRVLIILVCFVMIACFYVENAQYWVNSQNYALQRIGNTYVQFQNILNGSSLAFSSEAIRLSGIVYALELFTNRPLLGIGLGSLSCISGLVTFLVNGGIICVLLYILLIFSFALIRKDKASVVMLFIGIIFILPNSMLNEYETIMCMAIPLACYYYSILLNENNAFFANKNMNKRG